MDSNNIPGVDEADNMFKDDENDADRDPEGVEDLGDNNRDESYCLKLSKKPIFL